MSGERIVVIGLGGIGSHLMDPLCRYLLYRQVPMEVVLVDGDDYVARNRLRQRFEQQGNKALVTKQALVASFPEIRFRHEPIYVFPGNVASIIQEGDVVLLCVDNHATRKIVSDHCGTLKDVTLISGGNDREDGNVIYHARREGRDLTPSPTDLDPSIASPTDHIPQIRCGCEQEVVDDPQLVFTNLMAAAIMCLVYRAHVEERADFQQVYFDGRTIRVRPSTR